MFKTADRMDNLPFSEIRIMMEKATKMQQEGCDIIHMEVGRPDFDTPRSSKTRCTRASRTEMFFTPRTMAPPRCARPSPKN